MKQIGISLSAIILFASIFIWIGSQQGIIKKQSEEILSLRNEKLDKAVYESDKKGLYDIINLSNIKNNTEHEAIIKSLDKIDSKLDKITIIGK